MIFLPLSVQVKRKLEVKAALCTALARSVLCRTKHSLETRVTLRYSPETRARCGFLSLLLIWLAIWLEHFSHYDLEPLPLRIALDQHPNILCYRRRSAMDSRVERGQATEDQVTGATESVTSQAPSSLFLGLALGSMAVSAILKNIGQG